jgi:hypothetical protein
VDGEVGIAVARNLVARGDHVPEQFRMRAGGHTQDKERRSHPELVEQLEQSGRLPRKGRARLLPVRSADPPPDELMPVLEVDAQEQRLAVGGLVHRSAQILTSYVNGVR